MLFLAWNRAAGKTQTVLEIKIKMPIISVQVVENKAQI